MKQASVYKRESRFLAYNEIIDGSRNCFDYEEISCG